MKARLFVVDNESIDNVFKNMEVSIKLPEPAGKRFWNKTIQDIAGDLMQVEIGDYVFLWEAGTEKIYGVFRAVSRPFFEDKDKNNELFRIKVDRAYVFNNPIREYDIINNPYMKNRLWNIIGKKVAGKSRGTTPITYDEMQFLIQSLIDVNKNYVFNKDFNVVEVDNELVFDLKNEYITEVPRNLKEYKYAPIKIKSGTEVHFEKALEGMLNYLLREHRKDVIDALEIDCDNVVWFANYLPYGLERSEIDYMIMESCDGVNINRINVIELMRGIIDEEHIDRCLQYAKWVKGTLANERSIVRPVLICGNQSRNSSNGFQNKDIDLAISNNPTTYGFEEIEIYTYTIDEDISFAKYER